MISDYETNTVYISGETKLHFPKFANQLEEIVTSRKYYFKILNGTKDYFCRDYMPVQVDIDDFVQFVFRPKAYYDLMTAKHLTNPMLVEFENKIPQLQPRYSSIILDGGNLVRTDGKVIISTRVLQDNYYQFPGNYTILAELEKYLEAEVIIIPAYPEKIEKTGHADGLVRFIDESRVLINRPKPGDADDADLHKKLKKVLTQKRLETVEMPYFDLGNDTAIGLYINFLQVGTLIVFPRFGNKVMDREAEQILTAAFGKENVIGIDAVTLAKHGGVLNCATWTLFDTELILDRMQMPEEPLN